MGVTLNLSDKRAKAVLKVYEQEKRELFSKMEDIKTEIKELDIVINDIVESLNEGGVNKTVQDTLFKDYKGRDFAYNPKMSKARKAEWALKVAGRPLTVHEITDIIEEREPHLFIGEREVKRRDYANQISSPLGTKSKEARVFFREKKEGDTHYKYGLLEWTGNNKKDRRKVL